MTGREQASKVFSCQSANLPVRTSPIRSTAVLHYLKKMSALSILKAFEEKGKFELCLNL